MMQKVPDPNNSFTLPNFTYKGLYIFISITLHKLMPIHKLPAYKHNLLHASTHTRP